MTLRELEAMRKVDVRKAEKESLVDVREITVDKELPMEERVRDFMDKVKKYKAYLDYFRIAYLA